MKKIILAAIFIVTAIAVQAQEKVKWVGFEEAVELNKKDPKPILVDLYTDWCGWCKRMDKDTYSNEVIAKYINENYYAVKMDGEGKEDIQYKDKTFKFVQQGRSKYHEFAAAIMNGKMSYPSTAFFNAEQQLLQTVPGYLSKEKFEKILAFFGGGNEGKEEWPAFEKNFKSAL